MYGKDDEEPKGSEFTPDGGYIPRVLFLDSDGKVHPELKAIGGNPKYGYFYSDTKLLEKTMDAVVLKFSSPTKDEL
eukprot:Awhi_evm1s6236